MTNENLNLPLPPSPEELYDQLCNLQQLITYLSDEQLQQTIDWCIVANSENDEDFIQLLNICAMELQERRAYDYLTQDQVADMLGNDNAHYAWDGDDLFYLAHPDQREDNY